MVRENTDCTGETIYLQQLHMLQGLEAIRSNRCLVMKRAILTSKLALTLTCLQYNCS